MARFEYSTHTSHKDIVKFTALPATTSGMSNHSDAFAMKRTSPDEINTFDRVVIVLRSERELGTCVQSVKQNVGIDVYTCKRKFRFNGTTIAEFHEVLPFLQDQRDHNFDDAKQFFLPADVTKPVTDLEILTGQRIRSSSIAGS